MRWDLSGVQHWDGGCCEAHIGYNKGCGMQWDLSEAQRGAEDAVGLRVWWDPSGVQQGDRDTMGPV